MNAKEEIKNLKRSIELQFGLKRNGDADALAMMNWYKRLSQIEAAIFDVPSDEEEENEFHALLEKRVTKEAAIIYSMGWQDSKRYFFNRRIFFEKYL